MASPRNNAEYCAQHLSDGAKQSIDGDTLGPFYLEVILRSYFVRTFLNSMFNLFFLTYLFPVAPEARHIGCAKLGMSSFLLLLF